MRCQGDSSTQTISLTLCTDNSEAADVLFWTAPTVAVLFRRGWMRWIGVALRRLETVSSLLSSLYDMLRGFLRGVVVPGEMRPSANDVLTPLLPFRPSRLEGVATPSWGLKPTSLLRTPGETGSGPLSCAPGHWNARRFLVSSSAGTCAPESKFSIRAPPSSQPESLRFATCFWVCVGECETVSIGEEMHNAHPSSEVRQVKSIITALERGDRQLVIVNISRDSDF